MTYRGHPGVRLHFRCKGARWDDEERGVEHRVVLTGRTRPTDARTRPHFRKSPITREWECSCGQTGWSNHIELGRLESK